MKSSIWTIFVWLSFVAILAIAIPYLRGSFGHTSNANNISQNDASALAIEALGKYLIKDWEKEYKMATAIKSRGGWLITFENSKSVKIEVVVSNDRETTVLPQR
ncbi:MAG TPA: hypothetical protein DDW84_09420 [Phycisphaerales bacterium]|nr:hypothetical protein [Phycisphaerales bacterium]HBR20073.1 hypothetical protein [Phycisphaerales bacterium]